MKKISCWMLVLCLLIGLLPSTVLTATAENYSGKCGDDLSWTFNSDTGVLNIFGKGSMYDFYGYANDDDSVPDKPWREHKGNIIAVVIGDGVESIGAYAFDTCFNLKSVSFPNSLTSIGRNAFESCESLSSVTIPNSVTSIGECSFKRCLGLTSVTLSNSVTSLADDMFGSCSNLVSIEIPNSVLSIGYGTFASCAKLVNVSIGNSVERIGEFAFSYCGMKNVTIPNSVTTIADYAFCYCNSLENITIPNSVISIGMATFYNCASLTNVWISASVEKIGDAAFNVCRKLAGIWVDEANPYFCSDEMGVLFNKDKSTLIRFPNTYSGGYSVPKSVNYIYKSAFVACESLTNVMISANVTNIGGAAFDGCKSLYSVKILNPECVIYEEARTLGVRGFTTIYGYDYSTAYYYAHQFNYNFIVLCDQHNLVHMKAKEATCTEPGNIEYWYCETCYAYFLDAQAKNEVDYSEITISPLGHSYNVYENLAPTCTEQGYIVYACNCGDQYFEYIPATGHSVENGVCTNCGKEVSDEMPENPFNDVKETNYFYTPVLWAVANGITNGTSATTFGANDLCTRGQVVTFLWRACGSPEPTKTDNPFKDVKSSAFYYKAVLWAVENGITTGLSATEFGPSATCTRGQVATFLWRAKGKPAVTSSANPFSDVSTSAFYYKAVLWAVENNVTTGTGAGKFSPADDCTRGQIVTFLYRAFH